jgi:hypothetical protein
MTAGVLHLAAGETTFPLYPIGYFGRSVARYPP